MNNIEDRLRDAFGADAATIRPEELRPLPARLRSAGRAHHRRISWLVIPLAATTVAAVVIASVLVPKALPRHQATGGKPTSSSGPPRFFVATGHWFAGTAHSLDLVSISAATGRVVDGVLKLGHHRTPVAVASFGSPDHFVVAATPRQGCVTWLYQFHLTATGQLAGLRPLAVPDVPGLPLIRQTSQLIGASGSGPVVVTATQPCHASQDPGLYQVRAINTATRKVTTWTLRLAKAYLPGPYSLAVSADGRLVGVASSTPAGTRLPGALSAWTVPASAPSGPITRYWHRAVRTLQAPDIVTLSPDGRLLYGGVITETTIGQQSFHSLLVDQYQTATGKRIASRVVFKRLTSFWTFSLSGTGRYLLVGGGHHGRTRLNVIIDLTTGRVTKAHASALGSSSSVAW
jgi:hypothetical protein